jgi:hypothetical protein
LIASPADATARGADLDLDLLGILGVAGRERRPTLGTATLRFRQLTEILDDRQVTVVPPLWPRPILALAASGGLRRGRLLLAVQGIGTVPRRSSFALWAEELVLELAILTAKLCDLVFQLGDPLLGRGVLTSPIPGLLPPLEVLASQLGDVSAQLRDFLP